MPGRRSFRLVLGATAAMVLLAGCASSDSPVATTPAVGDGADSPTKSVAVSSDDAKKGLLYVADSTNAEIHIYPFAGKNQKEIGRLANVPVVDYLNVDRFHNLYVVEFAAGKVLVYPRGATQPSLSLSVQPPGNFPSAVATSPDGDIAVGQFQATGIEFFHKGSTLPYNTVAAPAAFGSAGFCAYDAHGNLYVIGSATHHASHIGEIVGGGRGSKVVDFGLSTGIKNAKGIQVDKKGNVAVVGDSGMLNVYKPASNTVLTTAQLVDPSGDGTNPNGGFALLNEGKNLYVASAILGAQNQGLALEYAYPGGGKPLNTIAVTIRQSGVGQTGGSAIAVDPPDRP